MDDVRKREEVVASIAARIRPVCPDMPQADFQAMVERMADIQIKYELWSGRDRRRS